MKENLNNISLLPLVINTQRRRSHLLIVLKSTWIELEEYPSTKVKDSRVLHGGATIKERIRIVVPVQWLVVKTLHRWWGEAAKVNEHHLLTQGRLLPTSSQPSRRSKQPTNTEEASQRAAKLICATKISSKDWSRSRGWTLLELVDLHLMPRMTLSFHFSPLNRIHCLAGGQVL